MKSIFKPRSGAGAFFLSILVWGVGVGCFMAAMNNFLADIHDMNSMERGWLEFFRELPGMMLVAALALLHKVSDWKVMRIGVLISMVGVSLLMLPVNKLWITAFIMVWSLGEHLVMPVRAAIVMQVAQKEHVGQALGLLTAAMNFGTVAGSLLVAGIFYCGVNYFARTEVQLFHFLWGFIAFLMLVSVISSFSPNAPNNPSKRPRLYFNSKFSKFYILELFYGARKQVFLTFAPYVLIKEYGFSTSQMALLLGICAAVNVFAAPLIGKITDWWGYRNTMIWDTVILAFVCLLYGFAGDIFPAGVVLGVLCVNFLLDAVLSTTALATNIYVRKISSSQDELTSTLSTGISINHLIAVMAAPLGGWVWAHYGIGVLFTFAALMAVLNTVFAMTLPKPESICQQQ